MLTDPEGAGRVPRYGCAPCISAERLDAFPLERQLGFRVLGLVGADLLRRYAVTLDFDRMRLLLETWERSSNRPAVA